MSASGCSLLGSYAPMSRSLADMCALDDDDDDASSECDGVVDTALLKIPNGLFDMMVGDEVQNFHVPIFGPSRLDSATVRLGLARLGCSHLKVM